MLLQPRHATFPVLVTTRWPLATVNTGGGGTFLPKTSISFRVSRAEGCENLFTFISLEHFRTLIKEKQIFSLIHAKLFTVTPSPSQRGSQFASVLFYTHI